MSRSHPILYRALAGVATLPLVLFSLVSWLARTDVASAPVEVVDAFVAARAARDLEAVAALLQANASVMDTGRDLAAGVDGLYQLMPIGDTLVVGPRHQEENGDVSWSEMVLDNSRPSWENNLNWWIDGNPAVEALQQMPRTGETSATQPSANGAAPTGYTRMMRVTATQAGITRIVANRADSLPVHGADAQARWALLAFVAAGVLLRSALFGPISASVSHSALKRRWLMPGLERWLIDRGPSIELEATEQLQSADQCNSRHVRGSGRLPRCH
jgi:hypothetical protein